MMAMTTRSSTSVKARRGKRQCAATLACEHRDARRKCIPKIVPPSSTGGQPSRIIGILGVTSQSCGLLMREPAMYACRHFTPSKLILLSDCSNVVPGAETEAARYELDLLSVTQCN
jgi:hypothetical protein